MGSHGNQETSVSRRRERWTTGFRDAKRPRKRRIDSAAQKLKVPRIRTFHGGVETGVGVSRNFWLKMVDRVHTSNFSVS